MYGCVCVYEVCHNATPYNIRPIIINPSIQYTFLMEYLVLAMIISLCVAVVFSIFLQVCLSICMYVSVCACVCVCGYVWFCVGVCECDFLHKVKH